MDGNREWSEIEPWHDDAFHEESVIVMATGDFTKAEWKDTVKGLVSNGAIISDVEILSEDGDEYFYQLTITPRDGDPMRMHSKGTFLDGQLLRLEPTDPQKYSDLVDRSE